MEITQMSSRTGRPSKRRVPEHERILDSIRAGDGDAAEAAMLDHTTRSRERSEEAA
jgi:DNA-binding GntR family transcriptional regulator